jgi:uracil-DNA glycosylase
MNLFEQMHPEWQLALSQCRTDLNAIDTRLKSSETTPPYELIMRAYQKPLSEIKVVIFGQDPYPTPGVAQGLAFSTSETAHKLPASLRNIYKELESDCGTQPRDSGDLTHWSEQGVFLLNRILTTQPGFSMAHVHVGWQSFTEATAAVLGSQNVIGVFWGNTVKDLQKYFDPELTIRSAHPSPLSAYRGFFGSKPFSTANELLIKQGKSLITW